MRVAIAGKGGSGKTTIAGTLARLCARSAVDVLAIDADLNPNLGVVLGVPAATLETLVPLPTDLFVQRRVGDEVRWQPTVPVDVLVRDYSAVGPDEVRLLLMGQPTHAGTGCMCSNHATLRKLLGVLPLGPGLVVADMEASPEHLTRATPEAVDRMLVIAEPYFRSLETARRQAALGVELGVPVVEVVANKVRDDQDAQAIEAFCERHQLQLAGVVPYDSGVGEADHEAASVVDRAVRTPAVEAIGALAGRLLVAAR